MSARTIPFPNKSKREPLTAAKLRTFPSCEHYSDEEAEEIVVTIKALARIFLKVASAHGTHYDNQRQGSATIILQDNIALKRAA